MQNKKTAQELWTTLVEFEKDLAAQREDLDAKITQVRYIERLRNEHLKKQCELRLFALESALNETKLHCYREVDRAEMQLADLQSEIHRDLAAQFKLNVGLNPQNLDANAMSLEEARHTVGQLVVLSHVQTKVKRGLEKEISVKKTELETTSQNLSRTGVALKQLRRHSVALVKNSNFYEDSKLQKQLLSLLEETPEQDEENL